jgi:hypothetical protein
MVGKKRVKKRTHVRKVENPGDPKVPKSFVIRTGRTTADPISSVLAQLVLDFRKIMEPNTASRLRVSSSSPFLRCPSCICRVPFQGNAFMRWDIGFVVGCLADSVRNDMGIS